MEIIHKVYQSFTYRYAGFSLQESLASIKDVLNLTTIGATQLGTASDIVTKKLVGLVEILFKKHSVNCWKAKLILIPQINN